MTYVRGKRIRPLTERLAAKLDTSDPTGCWPYLGNRLPKGYGTINAGGGQGMTYAHRAMFQLVNGYLPPIVRHRCDNPPCCNPAHLEPGTIAENNRDMVTRNRVRRGAANRASRLTPDAVRDIRCSSDKQAVLADRYGVSQSTISDVRNNRRWTHL